MVAAVSARRGSAGGGTSAYNAGHGAFDYTIVDTSTGFSIELVWSRILGIPSPGAGNAPSLLTYLSGVEPCSRAKAAARRSWYKIAAVVIALLVFFGIVVSAPDGSRTWFFSL